MINLLSKFFLLLFYTGTINSELNEPKETQNEEIEYNNNVAVHDNYRPKHKFKIGTGHQEFKKRFADFNTFQDIKNHQCAVMYKNNEPVGILQPYEESYRFLPVQGESSLVDINPIPSKRKTVVDIMYPNEFSEESSADDKIADKSKFSDDRYPLIFAKFKIDSKLGTEKQSQQDLMKKKSMFKRENNDKSGVEDKLKNILDDMGLIDDYPNVESKREAVEDENLETGTNRINLVKEGKEIRSNNNENREKRSTGSIEDINDYEKRVEREIRDKIQELKEEVKREMNNLTNNETDETTRQKRQIKTTLLDEENKSIDPTFNIDENDEKNYIRKKRNVNMDPIQENEKVNDAYDNVDEGKNNNYECQCDKNGNNCRCNRKLTNFDEKSVNKKSVKQICNCDKQGNNCKCENQLKDTIPSIREEYSDYNELADDYADDTSSWNDDKSYENEYNNYDYPNNKEKFGKRAIKARKYALNKPFENGEYFVDLQPEIYNLSPKDRTKKSILLPHSRYRRRIFKEENNMVPRQLIDMSDEDLFGALPQGFDGELLRYKRVKRNEILK